MKKEVEAELSHASRLTIAIVQVLCTLTSIQVILNIKTILLLILLIFHCWFLKSPCPYEMSIAVHPCVFLSSINLQLSPKPHHTLSSIIIHCLYLNAITPFTCPCHTCTLHGNDQSMNDYQWNLRLAFYTCT